jgi:hypothetical protein
MIQKCKNFLKKKVGNAYNSLSIDSISPSLKYPSAAITFLHLAGFIAAPVTGYASTALACSILYKKGLFDFDRWSSMNLVAFGMVGTALYSGIRTISCFSTPVVILLGIATTAKEISKITKVLEPNQPAQPYSVTDDMARAFSSFSIKNLGNSLCGAFKSSIFPGALYALGARAIMGSQVSLAAIPILLAGRKAYTYFLNNQSRADVAQNSQRTIVNGVLQRSQTVREIN